MAGGVLFTVLSNIPWGQVIDNAPKLAEGATRLWNSVGGLRKKAPAQAQQAPPDAALQTPAELLAAQVQALQDEVRELSAQMQASTELLKALAEQNTQLVQRIELNRVRLRQLAGAALAAAVAGAVAIGYLLLRG